VGGSATSNIRNSIELYFCTIASRMESSGEAGKVNISGSTYQLVKDKFNCEYRGEIEAKGKGKVKMYFIEGSSR